MSKFGDFLSGRGNLHDCTVTSLEWKPEKASLAFEIDDLHFNFEGFPEYEGPEPGRIVLEQVQIVAGDVAALIPPLHIFDFSLTSEGSDGSQASISFWPSGEIKVNFRSHKVLLRKDQHP